MIDIGGMSELKTALDIIKGMKNLFSSPSRSSKSSAQAVNAQLLEIQSLLLTTQEKQFTLTERIRELEEDIAKHKNWEKEKTRYKFTQLPGTMGGTFPVYSLRDEVMKKGEEMHRICAACYEEGKKSILSFSQHPLSGLIPYCPVHDWGKVPLDPEHF